MTNLSKCFVLILSIFSCMTYAGSQYKGKVKVHCNIEFNHCNVNVLGNASSTPACASNPKWYVLKMDSMVWRQQLDIALKAQLAGRNVYIRGSGKCSQRAGVHEDLQSITLEN